MRCSARKKEAYLKGHDFPESNMQAGGMTVKYSDLIDVQCGVITYLLMAFAGALAATGCRAADSGVEPARVDPRGTRYSGKETLHLGEIFLETNEWSDTNQTTCIFLDKDGTFGIEWERGATGTEHIPNYPKAEIGIGPWNADGDPKNSSSALLPIKLKDLKSASMTLDVTTITTTNHGWNLAFELWLSDADPTKGKAGPKAELMVFLGNYPKYWPWEPKGGTFSDGHNTYRLWESSDEWQNWGYYRQWRIGNTTGIAHFNGTVDIYAFLKHHMEEDGWDENLWLTRFEIGNETYQHSGGVTRFKALSFEVNGETRSAITE